MERPTYKATLEKQGHSAKIKIGEQAVVVVKTRNGFRLMVRTTKANGRPYLVVLQEYRRNGPDISVEEHRWFDGRKP